MRSGFLVLVILLTLASEIIGQSPPPGRIYGTNPSVNPATERSDTTASRKSKKSFGSLFSGQPGKAALYSLVLPGAGQIYNKRYWKLPLVIAAEGIAGYILLDRLDDYRLWNECYSATLDNMISESCRGQTDVSRIFRIRQSARSNKELAWVFMGVTHLFVALEAFIDRHLINFDTSEDLSFNLFPLQNADKGELPKLYSETTFIQFNIPLNQSYYQKDRLRRTK